MADPKLAAKAKVQKRRSDGKFGSGGGKASDIKTPVRKSTRFAATGALLNRLVKKYGSVEAASRSPEWRATQSFKNARKFMKGKRGKDTFDRK